jgi:hypothetical protein
VQQADRQALDAIVAMAATVPHAEMEAARSIVTELATQRLARARSLARSSRAVASCSSTR